MSKNVWAAVTAAAIKLLRNWRSVAIFIGLYAALLLMIYLFFTTKEARLWELLLNLVLILLAPALFFVIQCLGVSYPQTGMSPGALLQRALRDFWKLVLVSVPVLILSWLCLGGLGLVEGWLGKRGAGVWPKIGIAALRYLLLGFVLPLIMIRLWIVALREGVGATFKRIGRNLVGAFAPHCVLIYAAGLIVFALIPYFLISVRTAVQQAWLELGLLGVRLTLALLLMLFGWVITLGALAEISRPADGA